jgi:predicted nucleotidyltransferase component of viral defense system
MLEELDLPAWVAKAPRGKSSFREAVHIVLHAISTSLALRSMMVMKGGMLMAIRYDSSRFTKDADFSTREKYAKHSEAELLEELDRQLTSANDQLPYDTICRRQRAVIKPARADAQFPTLSVSIGYAQRSQAPALAKLNSGQAPTVVQIDYSYNEAVYDVELLGLGDGDQLQAYSFLNLLAEKMRALLQQPIRNRNRRQDVYDLNLLIAFGTALTAEEQMSLLGLLATSCRERGIEPNKDSLANPVVKKMAGEGYEDLAPEVEGDLPPFEEAYSRVQNFYEGLPWDKLPAPTPKADDQATDP